MLRESMQVELVSHGIQPENKSESWFKFEVDCTKWFYDVCQSLFIFSACILGTSGLCILGTSGQGFWFTSCGVGRGRW